MSKHSSLLSSFIGFGPADRSHIDLGDEWQVRWWCKFFGCTNAELLAAVRAVGIQTHQVMKYLERPRAAVNPNLPFPQRSQSKRRTTSL